MSESVSSAEVPEGPTGEASGGSALPARARPPVGPPVSAVRRGPGRPKGSTSKKHGKGPAKPAATRPSTPAPALQPPAPRAPAPAAAPAALLFKDPAELAGYLAKGGALAEMLTAGRPRWELLAEGVRWHDREATAAAVARMGAEIAGLISEGKATLAGLTVDAVPAPHVLMACNLAWPWLVKSGFLSADVLSDEWRLAAAVLLLVGPLFPALWKFAIYREPPPPEKTGATARNAQPQEGAALRAVAREVATVNGAAP